ncbi:MAG: lysophospholipid acyltransferase family protein [Syntrophobacterales bacterium]|nr:lysophospholipid acyltransferase family protein [Syntrophobacterales bacterium]
MNATDASRIHPDSAQWTSRSIGSRFGHKVFYLFIRSTGRRGAYFFLYFVVLFYVFFAPSIRKKADYYLHRRFERKRFLERLMDTYRIYLNLGRALIDRAIIGILGPDKIHMEFRQRRVLYDLVGEGRGLILLTAHVGCWQAAMSTLEALRVPVHLLLHREEGDVDLHYFEHAGVRAPYGIIDPKGSMGGVLEMISVLKKGEVLSLMGDRLLGSRKGATEVDFLGEKALFPYSAYKIAAAIGTPIGVLFSYKSGPASYSLELAKVIRVPSDAAKEDRHFRPYVAEFARALECYTAAHPYQFFNFYDLWERT